MAKEDILGGLKNALERGETMQAAKDTFITAGYSKSDVEDASLDLEKIRSGKRDTPMPGIYSAELQIPKPNENIPKAPSTQTTSAQTENVKPLPQIKVKTKFHYWLLIPIVIVSAAIAYLIYSILLAQ